jgi:hypothetical protein
MIVMPVLYAIIYNVREEDVATATSPGPSAPEAPVVLAK